MESRQE
ncbi:MAG: hypothetical protein EZS28_020704, partial [Streblomastix strix]